MIPVNKESELGSIIPDVYIRKISLLSNGSLVYESNPHVDHEREPKSYRDATTGKIKRKLFDKRDFEFKEPNSDPMTVELTLIVKERLDNKSLGTWFNNNDFAKYMRIKIIQSMDRGFTEQFATKSLDITSNEFELLWKQQTNSNSTKLAVKTIPLKLTQTESSLDQYEKEIDENGDTVYNITFQVSFHVHDSNPKHLAYFAMSYLDAEALASDFGLNLPGGMEKEIDGNLIGESVIDEYKLTSETYIFLDEGGSAWTGPVHQQEDGRWRTGAIESADAKFLELTSITNSTVQDFRDVKDLERKQIDFSIINNEILGADLEVKHAFSDRNNIGGTYFTEAFIARDSEANVRFLFGFDMLALAIKHTAFGSLYRRNNQKELLKNIKIRNMKIVRIRGANNSNGLKDENGIDWFDKNEEPAVVVVSSRESEPGNFNTIVGSDGSLREIDLLLDGVVGHRFFTGIDKTMDTITFGKYQYSVVIDVEDRTSNYLKSVLDDLLESYQSLQGYYNECVTPENFNVITNSFTQNFADMMQKSGSERWTDGVESYLKTMDTLHKDFDVNRYAGVLLSYVHPLTGNPSGVLMMLNLMEQLTSKLASILGTSISGKVSKWIPGQSQHQPSSVKMRGALPLRVMTLTKYFPQYHDADLPKKIGYDYLSSGEIEIEDNDDGLKVVSLAKFEGRADAEVLKYYKSLDSDINIKSESNIYTTDDAISQGKFSYLTPASVNFGKTVTFLDQGQSLFLPEKNLEAVTSIALFNSISGGPNKSTRQLGQIDEASGLTQGQQALRNNLSPMLQQRGVLIESPRKMKAIERQAPFLKATDMFSTGSTFNKENKIVTEIKTREASRDITATNPNALMMEILKPVLAGEEVYPSKQRESRLSKVKTIQAYNVNSPENLLDKIPSKTGARTASREPTATPEVQAVIKALPMQIKSIFVGGTLPQSVNKNWFEEAIVDPLSDVAQKPGFDMNYFNLRKIEVMTGFKVSSKDAKWQIMTPAMFNKATNQNLLCRLSKYENKDFGVTTSKELELPIYNEYFILSPKQQIVSQPPAVKNPEPSRDSVIKAKVSEVNTAKSQISIRPDIGTSIIVAPIRPVKEVTSIEPTFDIKNRVRNR